MIGFARVNGRRLLAMNVSMLKAAFSALLLIFLCIFGALTMVIGKALHLRLVESFPLFFHGLVCRLFSLRCEIEGTPSAAQPTLYVANHVSYLDVFVLGSLLKGSFVAKSDVASWPVFGKLAKLQNTLFLERNPRRAAEQIQAVREHLQQGGNLIMFPEGTSTEGTHVAPFRSSLFAAAEDVCVQPVTVAYVSYAGVTMTQPMRDRYAWYLPNPKEHPATPNRPFATHLVAAMGLQTCTVKVRFHDPVLLTPGKRKACAQHCESSVRRGLEDLLGFGPTTIAPTELTSAT